MCRLTGFESQRPVYMSGININININIDIDIDIDNSNTSNDTTPCVGPIDSFLFCKLTLCVQIKTASAGSGSSDPGMGGQTFFFSLQSRVDPVM